MSAFDRMLDPPVQPVASATGQPSAVAHPEHADVPAVDASAELLDAASLETSPRDEPASGGQRIGEDEPPTRRRDSRMPAVDGGRNTQPQSLESQREVLQPETREQRPLFIAPLTPSAPRPQATPAPVPLQSARREPPASPPSLLGGGSPRAQGPAAPMPARDVPNVPRPAPRGLAYPDQDVPPPRPAAPERPRAIPERGLEPRVLEVRPIEVTPPNPSVAVRRADVEAIRRELAGPSSDLPRHTLAPNRTELASETRALVRRDPVEPASAPSGERHRPPTKPREPASPGAAPPEKTSPARPRASPSSAQNADPILTRREQPKTEPSERPLPARREQPTRAAESPTPAVQDADAPAAKEHTIAPRISITVGRVEIRSRAPASKPPSPARPARTARVHGIDPGLGFGAGRRW